MGGDAHPFNRRFAHHEVLVGMLPLAEPTVRCGVSHGLLLGECERCSGAGCRQACVGVGGLARRLLLVGVLRQESSGRVGRSGLRLGEVIYVADALVAHVFSRVQQLFWMTPRVLGEERRQHCRFTGCLLKRRKS